MKMAEGTCRAVVMMMTDRQLGMMWRRRIFPFEVPMVRAARTYSSFLICRI